MLLIGLITSGILFVSSANKRLEMNFNLQEHMLFNNYLGLQYGANMPEVGSKQLIHHSGDTSQITVKNWGAFRVVVSETKHNNRFFSKSAIVGYKIDVSRPTLYVPDQRQTIKLCGNTRIEGKAFLPERGLERGYIAGKNYENDKLIYGEQLKSDKYLPSISEAVLNLNVSHYLANAIKIDPFQNDSVFRFNDQTRIVSSIEALFIQQNITGNVIIHSFDSIVVSSNAHLENVILIAPTIRFESGFQGSVQAIAHKRIVLEEHVQLNYPSALLLNENQLNEDFTTNGIFLQEGSRILGGVLLVSQNPNFRKPLQLKVDKALLGGLVYNVGETELKGKIIGHLYTNAFRLKSGGGEYSNYLLDASISSDKLPKEFIAPVWLKEEKKTKAKIIMRF